MALAPGDTVIDRRTEERVGWVIGTSTQDDELVVKVRTSSGVRWFFAEHLRLARH